MAEKFAWPRSAPLVWTLFLNLYLISPLRIGAIGPPGPMDSQPIDDRPLDDFPFSDIDSDLTFEDLEGNSKYVVQPVSSPHIVDDAHPSKRKIGHDTRQSFTDDEDYLLEEGSADIEGSAEKPKVTTPSVDEAVPTLHLPEITPPPPLPVYIRVHLNITNLMYTDIISDRNSPQFVDLAKEIEKNMRPLFADIPGDQAVTVLKFEPFPLLVTIDLGSVEFYDEQVLYRVFQDAVARGNIGPYTLSHLGFQIKTIGFPTVTVMPPIDCNSDEYACPSGKCIKMTSICDGNFDCPDKSDEKECAPVECRDTEFYCNDGACVSIEDKCNGRSDCIDGEDELGCPPIVIQCREGQFRCHTEPRCISEEQRCDGFADCHDKSDESNCSPIVIQCREGQFRCHTEPKCIPEERRCNGFKDCNDNSDESDCPLPLICKQGEYQCLSGTCIPESYHCNRRVDCPDGSDEDGCPTESPSITCSSNEFKCKDNYCIPAAKRCDGSVDCSYGEDEDVCPSPTVCLSHEFRCDYGGPCLDIRRKCDGHFDCSDRSDERSCIVPCKSHEFQCKSGQCIDGSRHCDGITHCSDRSDEVNCPLPPCSNEQFQCKDGTCLPQHQKCDKVVDCSTGEDELNCSKSCRSDEFRCLDNGLCIDIKRKCDRIPDCPDKSDERDCVGPCRQEEFRCGSGECIDSRKKCDNRYDCRDGSDEQKCVSPHYDCEYGSPEEKCKEPCRSTQFQCGSGECIDVRQRCNGHFDCSDRSDEEGCAPPSTCRPDEFRCSAGHCISNSKRCNGIFDCPDRSDEENCVSCSPGEFPCRSSGECIDFFRRCDGELDCRDGSDELSCTDIDCGQGKFRCDGNRCVEDVYRCNGQRDCVDGTDEEQCVSCQAHELDCGFGQCVDRRRKCDGHRDCFSGLDEQDCAGCQRHEFDCGFGQCIDSRRKCDGYKDCTNGLDEEGCAGCQRHEFECELGQCIDSRRKCDGHRDCTNGLDEENCGCPAHEFDCGHGQCIDSRRKCDGRRDCTNGVDEEGCGCQGHEFDCGLGQCIDSRRKCDGHRDCNSGLDEESCGCQGHEFDCGSGECIDSRRKCDGRRDCSNGLDEEGCAGCQRHEFDCGFGQCIDSRRKCDGYRDCTNGLDEEGCARECGQGEKKCNSGECINEKLFCNNRDDCRDGSDERNCPPATCRPGEFRCTSGECIDNRRLCDDYPDCGDNSDEKDCREPPSPCQSHESLCQSGECIDSRRFCDGRRDCADGSDEARCGVCKEHETLCQSGECIDSRRICDGYKDCADGSDEERCPGPIFPHIYACSNTPHEFKCTDGACIESHRRCNEQLDCRDGSDEENCTLIPPIGVPSSPQHLSVKNVPGDPTSVYVYWHPPEIPSGVITGYLLLYTSDITLPDNDWTVQSLLPDDRVTTIKDLSPAKKYYFKIKASNAVGYGRPSEIVQSKTPSAVYGCTSQQFQCQDGQCIDKAHHCDGVRNCRDGSDEINCVVPGPDCPPGMFQCYSKQCVSLHVKCDGKFDCDDYSDEIGCSTQQVQMIMIPKNLTIPEGQEVVLQCLVRGVYDARTRWSKERGPLPIQATDINGRLTISDVRPEDAGIYTCTVYGITGDYRSDVPVIVIPVPRTEKPFPIPCTRDEATCRNGQCIQKDYICDGDFDCDDRSDELTCVTIMHCEPNEFKCDNEKCIQKIWRCDGDDDCGDNTDERNCGTSAPGTSCRLDEYKCATIDQCIPKSFHCDGERDCGDLSDEIGCSPPTVIRPPPEQMTATVGQTVEIVCEAIGIPTPLISWRLNWGNIPPPPRVTTTSENGRGTLIIRNVMESDQGAYSCEAINVKDSIIATPDTILTVELPAGICSPPLFNAGASSSRDCISCFCFGITQQCVSSNYFLSQLPIGNEISLTSIDGQIVIDRNRLQYRPTNREFTVLNAQDILRPGHVFYWTLPRHFLGNKLTSYGGSISYSINYRVIRNPIFRDHMDVILKGNNISLYHRVSQRIEPGKENRIDVPLRENLWLRGREGSGHIVKDEWATNVFPHRGDTPIKGVASRDELMTVLSNLEMIQIRATYDDYMSETSINNIAMDTAVPQNTGRPRATLVEECRCPPGYTGLSCESCAVGFRAVNIPGRPGIQCVGCNCHGHSNECDPETGECRNCQHNTIGPNCDQCRSGYYGNARQGQPSDCQACPCPLTTPSNQFSPTCFQSGDGTVTCDACAEGYTGRRCEICLSGYIGNPNQPGDRCRPIDQLCNTLGSLSPSPDPSTGQCLCKQFAVGANCDQCAPHTFHLSDANAHGCIACFCMGITQSCSSSSWYRTHINLRFIDDHHNVILNNMKRSEDVDQGLTVNYNARELLYRDFNRHSETLFWQLPDRFLGNKLSSYGGHLRYTIKYVQAPGGISTPEPDVELLGNNILLIYRRKERIPPNTDQSFQVPLLEQYWQREDGMPATREHIMMVLADLDVVFIKATYSTNTVESSIRDISLDIAEDRQSGQARAIMVEQCHCPPGYKGLSCEDCDFGFTRSGGGLYLGFCEACFCNGHSRECDSETGACKNCLHNTEGQSCELCKPGFYGDAKRGFPNDCQPCPCPLTSPPNQFSSSCILEADGLPSCTACQSGHTGRRCERCLPNYHGNPLVLGDSCRLTNGSCVCDHRGGLADECDPQTRACRCKTNVRGLACDQCAEGYFHLDEHNPMGCTRCFCFGITNHCSNSGYYREQIRLLITSSESHNFALANRRLTKILLDGFSVNPSANEITFRSFSEAPETYFWVLPPQFKGDKVTSYGGVLKYTQSFQASTTGTQFADVDVEIIGNDLRLFYITRPPLQQGETRTYEIPLTEHDWRKVDSRGIEAATREDFMMALAGIDSILIRASFYSEMLSSTLRSVEMDIAVPQNNGQVLANPVEVCRCPTGYAGLSCQDCAPGYQRDRSSGPYLGRCVQCNCNGHSDICDPTSGACVRCQHNTAGDRCELCLPGYYGDATVGTPNDCRLCPCPLTITSNRFSPTCYLDTDGRPTCDACPVGYSGRDCGTCAPGYTGDPRQPGDSCQPQPDGALVVNVYPKRISENIGATVTLRCQVGGSSTDHVNVHWTRADNTQLPARAVVNPDNSLTIQKLQNIDQGRYICTASSLYIEVQDYAEITVIGVQPLISVTITEPKQVTADERSTVIFRCTGVSQVSDVIYTLVWTKEGGTLPSGATDNNGVLTIPNVRPEDSGVYVCTGSNLYSTAQDRAYLNVGVNQEAPTVRIDPRFQTVSAGDPVEFRCIATGFPIPELEWTGGPNNVLNSHSSFVNGVFRIPAASRDDEAEYFCTAKNTAGSASVRTILFVKQNGGVPQVTVTPSESDVSIGSVAQFECQARGTPTPTITWTRLGGDLPPGCTQENGILIIPDVQESYRGYYTCTGSNLEGSVQAQARLNVVTITSVEPTARIEPERQTIAQGTTGILSCIVTGDPQPTIRWSRHGGELTSNHQINNNILRIVRAEIQDRGYYICSAENIRGVVQSTAIIEVEVREHPAIEIYPGDTQSIIRGGSALFQCRIVGGIPAPSIRWMRANSENFTETTEILNDGVIRFNRVLGNEQGTYICSAENEVGVVTATAILRIQGLPHVSITPHSPHIVKEGERVLLECVGEGDPTPTVSWQRFDAGREHIYAEDKDSAIYEIARASKHNSGQYICTARNAAGVSEARLELIVEEHYLPTPGLVDKEVVRVPVGGSAEFHCRYIGSDYVNIHWARTDGPMPSEHSVFNGILQIPNVREEDAGEYTCHGIQDGDIIVFSAAAHLEVISLPRVTVSPPSQTVSPGDYVRFHCQATGTDLISLEWVKIGGSLSPTAIITSDYLEIRQATAADAGQYRCSAITSGGRSEGFADLIISVPPTIRVPSRQEIVSIGSSIDLRCETTGNPPPVVTWAKEGEDLPPQHSIMNGYLRISNSREEDSGRYICTAQNYAGVARDYIYVTVQSHQKVEVHIEISKEFIQIGDSVDFICKVFGDPTARTHWTRVDAPMPNNAAIFNNVLRFSGVRLDNGGLYRCTAYTSVGPVSADAVFNMQGFDGSQQAEQTVKAPIGTTVNLHCSTPSYPHPVYSWSRQEGPLPREHISKNGQLIIPKVRPEDAGNYVCNARNPEGTINLLTILIITDVVPSFGGAPDSFIRLPPLKDAYVQFDIRISFKPDTTDGLLIYNGQQRDGGGDFISFGMSGGHAEFRFDVGAGPAIIRSEQPVDLGAWHTVSLRRDKRDGFLIIDDASVHGIAKGSFQGLDLVDNMYIGGVPNFNEISRMSGFQKGFIGCVGRLTIGGSEVDVVRDSLDHEGLGPCPTCDHNPCNNAGVCQEALTDTGFTCLCPPGFTGPFCESSTEICSEATCGHGRCVSSEFGVKCYCPLGKTGPRCEQEIVIIEPAFGDDSYLSYDTPSKALTYMNITMTFKPRTLDDGILMYCAQREDGTGDFISLTMKNQSVEFRFDSGSGTAIIRSPEILREEEWTKVVAERTVRNGALIVNDNEPITGISPGETKGLNLRTPLFFGGVDTQRVTVSPQVEVNHGFHGCISHIEVSDMTLDIIESVIDSSNIEDCGGRSPCESQPCLHDGICRAIDRNVYECICKDDYSGLNCEYVVDICTKSQPCQNFGTCVGDSKSYTCNCILGFSGVNCESNVHISNSIHLRGNGYLELNREYLSQSGDAASVVTLSFATNQSDGLLYWHGQEPEKSGRGQDYVSLSMKNGFLVFSYELGSGPAVITSSLPVNDGKPHTVTITRRGRNGEMEVDSTKVIGESGGVLQMLNTRGNIYIGGLPNMDFMSGGLHMTPWVGCIFDIDLQNNGYLDLDSDSVSGVNVLPCDNINYQTKLLH